MWKIQSELNEKQKALEAEQLSQPNTSEQMLGKFFIIYVSVHSGLPSITVLLPNEVRVPATSYDYLRPTQFAYTSMNL